MLQRMQVSELDVSGSHSVLMLEGHTNLSKLLSPLTHIHSKIYVQSTLYQSSHPEMRTNPSY